MVQRICSKRERLVWLHKMGLEEMAFGQSCDDQKNNFCHEIQEQ